MITYEECITKNFYETMMEMQEQYAQRTAFVWMEDGEERHVTYGRMVQDVRRLACVFSARHLEGQRVVVEGENGYLQIVALFSAIMAGACAAVLSFDVSEEEMEDTLNRIRPAAFVCQKDSLPELEPYIKRKGGGVFLMSEIAAVLNGDGELYEQKKRPQEDEDALILMTSGSSGKSKLPVLPQRAFWRHHEILEKDQILVNPLYHIAAVYAICVNLRHGRRMCLSDMRNGVRDIGWFRPQMMIAVPMYLDFLTKKEQSGEVDLSCFHLLIRVGAPGSRTSTEYLQAAGIPLGSLYGMTETAGAVTGISDGRCKPGSEGKTGRWNEVKISGRGEILVRGANVMTRYFDDEDSTRETLKEGWLHTGDTGYADEDGYLFLTGRIKNTIILSNGENVNPEMIESALQRCEIIREAVVRAEDDLIAAVVYCGEGTDEEKKRAVEAFIREYNKSVPTYRRIRRVIFRDEPFEKTASGKVKR